MNEVRIFSAANISQLESQVNSYVKSHKNVKFRIEFSNSAVVVKDKVEHNFFALVHGSTGL